MEHPSFIKGKECNSLVRNLGASGYDVRAIVWTSTVSENFQACSDLRIKIKEEFDKNNIEIPYTTITTIQSAENN
jgi:small-conductance mechanosensitive channel